MVIEAIGFVMAVVALELVLARLLKRRKRRRSARR